MGLLVATALSVWAALFAAGARAQARPETASEAAEANAIARASNPLFTGFAPDPRLYRGRVEADYDMPRNPGAREGVAIPDTSEYDGSTVRACVGRTSSAATHRIMLRTRVGFLRIFATNEEDADLSLAVRRPDGVWLCSDNRFGNMPSVESTFGAGIVEVHVGLVGESRAAEYVLHLTETRSIRPRQSAEAEGRASVADLGLITPETGGVNGNIRLRRGFLPDPRVLEGQAGGEIDVAVMGSACRGFLGASAAHRIELVGEFDFFAMHLERATATDSAPETEAQTAFPATVLVLAPDGHLLCQTVAAEEWHTGARALIAENQWSEGVYWIWIASSELNQNVRYRLVLSEVRRVR